MNNTPKPKVLIFELAGEKKLKLSKICEEMQLELVEVAIPDYQQQLGALTGLDGFSRKTSVFGMPFGSEMLIMSGMASEQMDLFLAAYKASGAAPISLKAVVTPVNVFWTPRQLVEELKKEREMFRKR